ncbi:MAG: phosphate ABC transporter ATP-binding protein PstB [Candidatus Bathyarchaeia archaeon]
MVDYFKVDVKGLNVWFKEVHVLKNVTVKLKPNAVTAIMGPSGCGKTTFIRAINRLNELIDGNRTTGEIYIDGKNIYSKETNVFELRRRVGMVFQKPNPFPKSIFENVAFGPRIHGVENEEELQKIVENSLIEAALWDEVKDRLNDSAFDLSGGQQQRLCIARALAVNPEVILLDEPCSALDPIATAKIEALMRKLAEKYTVIIVTHNVQQAARVSDFTVFLYLGELIEYGATKNVFENPESKLTEKYITGEFG